MAFPYPHLRPEHQERNIVFPGDADTGCPYIALQYAHPLDIVNDPLEKRHGVVLDHVALIVNQQHAQVMGIKMLFVLFVQPVHIFHNLGMGLLMLDDLFPCQTVDFGHRFMGQVQGPAALPGFRHPRVHVGIDDPFFHKFIVIGCQLFLISFFTNHRRFPLSHILSALAAAVIAG